MVDTKQPQITKDLKEIICPNCGGKLLKEFVWNPASNEIICDECDSVFTDLDFRQPLQDGFKKYLNNINVNMTQEVKDIIVYGDMSGDITITFAPMSVKNIKIVNKYREKDYIARNENDDSFTIRSASIPKPQVFYWVFGILAAIFGIARNFIEMLPSLAIGMSVTIIVILLAVFILLLVSINKERPKKRHRKIHTITVVCFYTLFIIVIALLLVAFTFNPLSDDMLQVTGFVEGDEFLVYAKCSFKPDKVTLIITNDKDEISEIALNGTDEFNWETRIKTSSVELDGTDSFNIKADLGNLSVRRTLYPKTKPQGKLPGLKDFTPSIELREDTFKYISNREMEKAGGYYIKDEKRIDFELSSSDKTTWTANLPKDIDDCIVFAEFLDKDYVIYIMEIELGIDVMPVTDEPFDGGKYTGGWSLRHDKPHDANGVLIWPDRAKYYKYEGAFVYGERTGEGKLWEPEGVGYNVYEGEFAGNYKKGHGTMTWESGNKYVGDWKRDKMHGNGTFTWGDDDDMYLEGVWDNNMLLGEGIVWFTKSDGSKGSYKVIEEVKGEYKKVG